MRAPSIPRATWLAMTAAWKFASKSSSPAKARKAIVLGKGGSRIKEIGQAAREELGQMLGKTVHLFLHVKVKEKWDEDRGLYREIGLDWVE